MLRFNLITYATLIHNVMAIYYMPTLRSFRHGILHTSTFECSMICAHMEWLRKRKSHTILDQLALQLVPLFV